MPTWHFSKPRIPARAVIVSIAALAVPFINTSFPSQEPNPASELVWLLALVPAFLLAFYRGWRGAATALAAGMAVLSAAVCVTLLRSTVLRADLLVPVLTAYIAIVLATGWLSERLHSGRASAEVLALTDELTGLANRRHVRLYLEAAVERAAAGEVLTIVMFDLDRFKAYNDRHGHVAGDVMLCRFAGVLRSAVGERGMPARYGGEEFLVVLSATDKEDALAFATGVREALRSAQTVHEYVTTSAGIATYGQTFRTARDMIVAADKALYHAKQAGRDRACLAVQTAVTGT